MFSIILQQHPSFFTVFLCSHLIISAVVLGWTKARHNRHWDNNMILPAIFLVAHAPGNTYSVKPHQPVHLMHLVGLEPARQRYFARRIYIRRYEQSYQILKSEYHEFSTFRN